MSVQEMRARAHQIVEEADEACLAQIITQHRDPKTNHIDGEPGVTVEQYNREIDEAMARVKAGQGVPHDEVMAGIEKKFGIAL